MSRLEVLGVGLVLGMLAGLAIGSSMARGATPRPLAEPVPSWTPVQLPSEAPQPEPPVESVGPSQVTLPGLGGASPEPVTTEATSLPPSTNAPAANVAPARTPRRTAAPTTGWHTATGTASWFCKPGVSACTSGYAASGLYAAAGPALRVGAWRGRVVLVNGLAVRLVDFCQCYGSRVIDLYASAFQQLASLSAGTVKVTVRW